MNQTITNSYNSTASFSLSNNFGNNQTSRLAQTTLYSPNNQSIEPKQPLFFRQKQAPIFQAPIGKWLQSGTDSKGNLSTIQISLYYSPEEGFTAKILKGTILKKTLPSSQVKCGIAINLKHHLFYQKMKEFLNIQNACVLSYPSVDNPDEIWIFEAKISAQRHIIAGKVELLKKNYKTALKCFKEGLNAQNEGRGPVENLELTIAEISREFLHKKILKSNRYLDIAQNGFERSVFSVIDSRPKTKTVFSHLFEVYTEKSQPDHCYLRALIHEHNEECYCAIDYYKRLALQKYPDSTFNPSACLKKIRTLCDNDEKKGFFLNVLESLDRDWLIRCRNETKDPVLETLILQKDAVRMIFEAQLAQMAKYNEDKKPTCFICHDVSELKVLKWVKYILAPDMRKINIVPRYSSADLEQGDGITKFEKEIATTDFAIIICTPGLKNKVDERDNNPTGVAIEVQLAELRIQDKKTYGKTFLVYLIGDSSATCPSIIFKDDLRPNMSINEVDGLYDYYAKVFELFGKMSGLKREDSNSRRDHFLIKAKDVLSGNINVLELEKWRKAKPK